MTGIISEIDAPVAGLEPRVELPGYAASDGVRALENTAGPDSGENTHCENAGDDSTGMDSAHPTGRQSIWRLCEALIRDEAGLDVWVVDESRQYATLVGLLTLSLLGTALYGAGVGFVMQLLEPAGGALILGVSTPGVTVPIALTAAFLLAQMVCLPSFYFYTQLSGLDASFRLVTLQALRVQARTGLLLLGALPFYFAAGLVYCIGNTSTPGRIALYGLFLPFLVGLVGIRSVKKSFGRLADVLPSAHRRPAHFLARMVVAWGAVFSAVCPLALFRLLTTLSAIG